MSTSPFDRISNEILEGIIDETIVCFEHISFMHDIPMCRLVCKRWKRIADVIFFKKLVIKDKRHNRESFERLLHPFKSQPDIGKYLKVLLLKQDLTEEFAKCYLTDLFFKLFPNIQTVSATLSSRWSTWKTFSSTFTSQRCQLKTLPRVSSNTYNKYYIRSALDHGESLQELYLDNINVAEEYFLSAFNQLRKFKNVKTLRLNARMKDIKTYDYVLDMLPSLESLDITFCSVPNTKFKAHRSTVYKRPLQKLTVVDDDTENLEVCNYALSKFLSPQFLRVEKKGQYKGPPAALNGVVQKLLQNSIQRTDLGLNGIKYSSVRRSIPTTYSSYPDALKCVKMSYMEVEYTEGLPERSDDINMWISVQKRNPFSNTKLSQVNVQITYPNYGATHLELLQDIGSQIDALELVTPHSTDIIRRLRPEEVMLCELLFHALKYCTSFRELRLTCFHGTLRFNDLFKDDPFINTSVTKLELKCRSLEEKVLENLSRRAPNINQLALASPKSYHSLDPPMRYQIIMPHNDFKVLKLENFLESSLVSRLNCRIKTEKHGVHYCRFERGEVIQITREMFDTVDDSIFTVLIECKSIRLLFLWEPPSLKRHACISFDVDTGQMQLISYLRALEMMVVADESLYNM